MGLQGDLTSFDAADVLRLLSWTKKSGTLDLSGDRGHGLVRVLNGKVVGGEVDGVRTSADAEVVYELLRFRIGTFLFEDGEPTADRKPASVDDVLAGAATLLSEWKAIESVVPDFDRNLRLVPVVAGDEVRVSADEWRAIVGLGGGGTVRQLGDRLEVSDLAVGGTVKGLIERGMAILDEPTVEPVDEDDSDPTSTDDPVFAEPEPSRAAVDDLPGFGPSPEVVGAQHDDDDNDDDDDDDHAAGEGGSDVEPTDEAVPTPNVPGRRAEDREGIRLDYEPGLDGAPAFRRSTLTGASRQGGPKPAAGSAPATSSPSRDAVESGRATERRPYVDLGAARPPAPVPASPAAPPPVSDPPPPPPPPPTVETEAPAGDASWQPAWAQTVGRDIPTVGDTTDATDPHGRKKGRRLFRRG